MRSILTSRLSIFVSHCVILGFTANALGQQAIQQGFFSHQPSGVGIQLSNEISGTPCTNADGSKSICERALKVVVSGDDTCDWSNGEQKICTIYGYEYDVEVDAPGGTINCKLSRSNTTEFGPGVETITGARTAEYTMQLATDRWHIVKMFMVGYKPTESRRIITEVHECYYGEQILTTIEFVLYFEPDVGPNLP